jgi:hypothetical protein
MIDRSSDSGIDLRDPWAGRIAYPAPSPSPEIAAAMGLSADREHRAWSQGPATDPVVTAETWGTFRDKDGDDEGSEERGDRLQATRGFTVEPLRMFEMDMIVSVEIQRRRSYRRYESGSDDDKTPIPPGTRIFLIKGDGSIRTI